MAKITQECVTHVVRHGECGSDYKEDCLGDILV